MVSMSVKKKEFEGFNIEAELTQKQASRKSFLLRAKLRLSRGRGQVLLGIINRGSIERDIKRKDHKEISRSREKGGEREYNNIDSDVGCEEDICIGESSGLGLVYFLFFILIVIIIIM